jgi:hypothetical protein
METAVRRSWRRSEAYEGTGYGIVEKEAGWEHYCNAVWHVTHICTASDSNGPTRIRHCFFKSVDEGIT